MTRDINSLETMGDIFAAHQTDSPDCLGPHLLQMSDLGMHCPRCGWAAVEPE